MIELNTKTIERLERIVVRKIDWSLQFFGKDKKCVLSDSRFNVGITDSDDRLIVGSESGAWAMVCFIGKMIGCSVSQMSSDDSFIIYQMKKHK